MKKNVFTLAIMMLSMTSMMAERRFEMLPYGNMDTWTVRYIKESRLMGGETKTLYAIGPNDTIRQNEAYVPVKGNPWGQSNMYAKVLGIETAVGAVKPEKRGKGYCCRLDNTISYIKTGNMYTMVTGSIFTGSAIEPAGLESKSHPEAVINRGVLFKGHPVALRLDYKALISPEDSLTSTKGDKRSTIYGHDCAEIIVLLQHRWEDADGKLHARRVGTASEHICSTIKDWVNGHEIPIRWGNITNNQDFQSYEALNHSVLMAKNSKGKMVKVQEEGFSLDQPTHLVIMISSSCAGTFCAKEGNTLWVDNIGLVYDDK